MLKLFLVILAILLPAILLMGYRVFFTKDGKFPNTHVEGNKAMRQRGIGCVKSQDRAEQKRKNILEIE
jgi:hypothetical protein